MRTTILPTWCRIARRTPRFGEPPAPTRRAARRGFTLLELVVVLMIMSILTLVAQPRLYHYVLRERVRRVGARLKMDLRILQSEAIRRRTKTAISFDVTNDFYSMWYYDSGGSQWLLLDDMGQNFLAVEAVGYDPDYQVNIESVSGSTTIKFDAYGVPSIGSTITMGVSFLRVSVNLDAAAGHVTGTALTDAPSKLPAPDQTIPSDAEIAATKPT